MKKILCFCFCFLMLGSSCFAYTDPELQIDGISKVELKKSTNNFRSAGDNLDPWAKGYYNLISWLFSATRGAFAYTGDALNRTKEWWTDFLNLRGETVEEFVPEHVTVENNTYIMDSTMENAMNQFAQYLFEEIPNKGVQYKCVDIYGKNFKHNGSSVDSTWLCEVCKKYQNDYYISLWLDNSNYSQNYYYNIKYNSGLPYVRLEPKNNGSLIKDIYYQDPTHDAGYFYGLYSLTGNNGGVQGNVPFTYYTVNQDLTLMSHVGSETYSMNRSLFALGVLRSQDLHIMFRDPFTMNTLEQKIPIVYQREEYLNFYNNGVGTGSDGFCYYPSNYSNSVNTSTINNMPTYQDCQDYSNFRDAINGSNNSVTNADMVNYITNIYPNGNDYTTNPAPPNDNGGGGSGGGLLDSLVDALGSIGTLIGSILSGILQALLNIVGAVIGWISSLVSIFTSLIPESFGNFMNVFYGLIPEPIMNGIIALFSLTCVMAVIRIIRK